MTCPAPAPAQTETAVERAVVAAFYERREGAVVPHIGESDLRQARELVQRFGEEKARALVEPLVEVVRRKWPECKSFSGAVQKYLGDAVRTWEQQQRRGARRSQARAQEEQERQETARRRDEQRRLEARWEALPEMRRGEIVDGILRTHPEHRGRTGILKVLCLQELARLEESASAPRVEESSAHTLV
jgi:hypothetical protein